MTAAAFRFHGELNDFLAPARRCRESTVRCAREATTKHMIEALGVPHTEVELILVNGEAAGFDRRLRDGDRVSVYPKFRTLEVGSLLRLREPPLHGYSFIADAHLGGLAHLLRMAGFDTRYRNDYEDREIVRIAGQEGRIVLTRDRDLLKYREVTHGCYVHAVKPAQQFIELIRRLDLAPHIRPLSLCLLCNAPLIPAERERIVARLPPSVRSRYARFTTCPMCGQVYWEGSHWKRMRMMVDRAAAGAQSTIPRQVP